MQAAPSPGRSTLSSRGTDAMSQASYNVPTGGSFSMVTFAGLMNGAYNALASQSAGASAPANGPGSAPQEFQTWFNTTNVTVPSLNIFDGVNWDFVGALDVAGNKTIGLPDMRGNVPAGLDDMGNSAASRLTSLTMTPDGVTPMATGGGQSLTLLQTNLPRLNWSVTDSGHNHTCSIAVTSGNQIPAAGGTAPFDTLNTVNTSTSTTGISVASGGSGTAVKILQPTATGTWYICL